MRDAIIGRARRIAKGQVAGTLGRSPELHKRPDAGNLIRVVDQFYG
jgi:hypothetical protein